MLRTLGATLVLLLSLAASSSAQTTHTVNLGSVTFDPSSLTIQVGDTVEWVWVLGSHNVESGVGGIHDGIFMSGLPVLPPQTFSLTFDQAFLDANPVPANSYDYYCIVHVGFGMSGTINVTTGVPALPLAGLVGLGVGLVAIGTLLLGSKRS